MEKLAATFAYVASADIKPLQQAVGAARLSSLRAIGSGGSLTAAHALAGLHQRYTDLLAAVATPLEAVDNPLDAEVATWLLSAGGKNPDIMAAAKTLILREPRHLGVLCGRSDSPLARLCRQHPYVDLLLYPSPAGKDGFLATNSLLGFTALLTRAYAVEFGSDADWQDTVKHMMPLLRDAAVTEAWEAAMGRLWTRPTTLVLHGPATRVGAIDLESKFTEAALGHLQLADYRNFAHGRHHWLAKRSESSAVLAFVTSADSVLAERTLDLLPRHVPRACIVFDGGPSAVALASVLAALRITGWAGYARSIDPGRPSIPNFGRKLYNLKLPRSPNVTESPRLSPRAVAAIARKAGVAHSGLSALTDLGRWREALDAFLARLRGANFAAIVLDYDGTMVDTRQRSEPVEPELAGELARIATAGIHIGIATGRGESVRRDLQECLPDDLWRRVLVGYYNGAELARLDDDSAPDGTVGVCAALRPLADALHRQPEIAEFACMEERSSQITLEATGMRKRRLWELALQVVLKTGIPRVTVTRSGHSVDIVAPGVSKLSVVRQLRETVGDEPVLVIGDRGRWPGNDHDLLSQPFALGVDEISGNPATCWHLGKPGQRGPTVAFDYLSALTARDGRLKFEVGAIQ